MATWLTPAAGQTAFGQGRLREMIKEHLEQNQGTFDNTGSTGANLSKQSIDVGGRSREFLLHVPDNVASKGPLPLLVAFHGGGGDMEFMADDKKYGLIQKSNQAGFIVAFPNGVGALGNKFATWNAGKCCGKARDEAVDDVAFVRQMIHEIEARVQVDPRRIYATGMSNGGMMAYKVACEMSDVFAAIASVAGTDNTVSCKPSKPISILHIHAMDDDHVLFNGGAGPGAFRDDAKINDFTSVASTISAWVSRQSCKTDAVSKPTVSVSGAATLAHCETHTGCAGGAEVELCVTPDGGHSWPGGGKTRIAKAAPSQALSANDVMWDFFVSKRRE